MPPKNIQGCLMRTGGRRSSVFLPTNRPKRLLSMPLILSLRTSKTPLFCARFSLPRNGRFFSLGDDIYFYFYYLILCVINTTAKLWINDYVILMLNNQITEMHAHPKILLVEDDPLFVNLYKIAFEGAGYEVTTAFDGEAGLNALKATDQKPTLVLSDVMMPKLNGMEMIKKMKEEENLKKIPVVLLTNLGGEEDAQRGIAAGAVTYLIKSNYTPKEIVAKVKEIVSSYARNHNVPDVSTPIKKIE